MGENRSLDEFLPADEDATERDTDGSVQDERTDSESAEAAGRTAAEDADPDGDEAGSERAGATDAADVDASAEVDASGEERSTADENPTAGDESVPNAESVEPTRATYRWDPDGGRCAGCGSTVERRWRDDDAFVCGDCKEW